MSDLKVGSVPFLNARPLIEELDSEVTLEFPSKLAVSLRRGKFDLALVPIMECLLHGSYRALDGVGVCSNGPVWSVLLLCRKEASEIKRVSLDKTSLTSHYLTKIVCEQFLKITPEYVNEGTKADADLLIGDRALEAYRSLPPGYLSKIDLGEIWKINTGLPFVYAVWAQGKDSAVDISTLELFRQKSLLGIESIPEFQIDDLERDYLTNAICYPIGKDEKRGIQELMQRLKGLGMENPKEINFV